MSPPVYPTFEQAYVSVLRKVFEEYEYAISSRGNPAREVVDVSFRLSNPRARLPFLEERPVNIVFNLAEVLWYLSGRDDLEMIAYYAPRLRAYSHDGKRLSGTAYGPTLFGRDSDEASQWSRVLDLLRTDPDTKRATITIFRPEELGNVTNPDVSCTVAAQFLLREGQLHLTVFMRANDGYVGMVSDVFSFTFIQEFAAAVLGVSLGHYTHHVVSMHVNDRDVDHVRRILAAENYRTEQRIHFPSPAMPSNTSWRHIVLVCEHEAALRANSVRHTPTSIAKIGLPFYWQDILLLLEAYRQIRHTGTQVSDDVVCALAPAYRWLFRRRWPTRISGSI